MLEGGEEVAVGDIQARCDVSIAEIRSSSQLSERITRDTPLIVVSMPTISLVF